MNAPGRLYRKFAILFVGLVGGTLVVSGAFTYVAPPAAASLSPTSGPTGGGTIVTVSGTDFVSGVTVTVGGASATVGVVTSTSIAITTPAGSAGSVDVVVTNPDTQASTLSGAFT